MADSHRRPAAGGLTVILLNRDSTMPITIMRKHGGDPLITIDVGTLRGANLSRYNLSPADFRDADLGGADLSFASLAGADFRGSRCVGTDFLGSDLSQADLRGALFVRARFAGARLEQTIIQWSSAELVSEMLSRAAVTDEQREFAHYGLIHGLCWMQLRALNHQLEAWAISVLETYVSDHVTDEAPEFLRTVAGAQKRKAKIDAQIAEIESTMKARALDPLYAHLPQFRPPENTPI